MDGEDDPSRRRELAAHQQGLHGVQRQLPALGDGGPADVPRRDGTDRSPRDAAEGRGLPQGRPRPEPGEYRRALQPLQDPFSRPDAEGRRHGVRLPPAGAGRRAVPARSRRRARADHRAGVRPGHRLLQPQQERVRQEGARRASGDEARRRRLRAGQPAHQGRPDDLRGGEGADRREAPQRCRPGQNGRGRLARREQGSSLPGGQGRSEPGLRERAGGDDTRCREGLGRRPSGREDRRHPAGRGGRRAGKGCKAAGHLLPVGDPRQPDASALGDGHTPGGRHHARRGAGEDRRAGQVARRGVRQAPLGPVRGGGSCGGWWPSRRSTCPRR